LQSPMEGSRFRRSIIGTPIFKCKTCSGSPLIDNVFRNSVGYDASKVEWLAELSSIESEL